MLLHSLLFAVSIFALPTLFWRVSNLILHLFWRRTWNTTSYSEREFVLRDDDDDDGFWLGEGLESWRKMQPSWAGRSWLPLAGSVFLKPSGTVVGKRYQGLAKVAHVLLHYCGASPPCWVWRSGQWGIAHVRGTVFFLAPCGTASLGCMSYYLFTSSRICRSSCTGRAGQFLLHVAWGCLWVSKQAKPSKTASLPKSQCLRLRIASWLTSVKLPVKNTSNN